jgi:hypothetical protein
MAKEQSRWKQQSQKGGILIRGADGKLYFLERHEEPTVASVVEVEEENRTEIEAALEKLGLTNTPFFYFDDIFKELEEIFFAMFTCIFAYVIFEPTSLSTGDWMERPEGQGGGGPAS